MRVIKYYILLLALLATACNDDHPSGGSQSPAEGVISVIITIPDYDGGSTRANPESGEDGNGREQGILKENAVHDINLFFYEGSGLNPGNAEKIKLSHIYIPSVNQEQVTMESLPFEKKITVTIDNAESVLGEGYGDKTISFVTVLNAGEMTGISNLSELRQYTGLSGTWKSDGDGGTGKEDNFVMSTAYDAPLGYVTFSNNRYEVGSSILVKNTGTGADADPDKLEGETTVERMCARIDLMFNDELTESGDELIYSVKETVDNNVKDLAKVHITNILPVNCMQKPSYLIRKVTESIPTSWTDAGLGMITWGGVENPNDGKTPANYVIEPRTIAKEQNDATLLADWYGVTCQALVKEDIKDLDKGKVKIYYLKAQSETLNGHEYKNLLLLGYANENVQSPAQYKSDYLTGMAFRAVYNPNHVYDYVTENGVKELKEVSYVGEGGKIYRYSPNSDKKVGESRCIYFVKQKAADDYKADHSDDNGVIQEFTGAKVYGDGEGKYVGFDCYYNLWLRHYNDMDDSSASDPHDAMPMEYAIVRNNIYRVGVTFSGPGDPTPELREPNSIKARIYVRKWNMRKETDPLQF